MPLAVCCCPPWRYITSAAATPVCSLPACLPAYSQEELLWEAQLVKVEPAELKKKCVSRRERGGGGAVQ